MFYGAIVAVEDSGPNRAETLDFLKLRPHISGRADGSAGNVRIRYMNRSVPGWYVPVRAEDVPAAGQHFELIADAATRTSLAAAASLVALPRLAAVFEVTRHGRDGLHVAGTVSASVRQTCVVTLDPIENEIEEAVDLTFVPAGRDQSVGHGEGRAEGMRDDAPETLVNGMVDLGAIAAEFLMIGIDPYPRKPGAEFAAPAADDLGGHPFAALAAIKNRESGG
jgi:uncharacterized metal-binding protein YceD (DUF177 family)